MKSVKTTVKCPACQSSFAVASFHDEQRGKCPKCGERFVMKSLGRSQDGPAASPQNNSRSRVENETSLQSADRKSTAIDKLSGRAMRRGSKTPVNEPCIGKIGRFELREVLGQGAFGRVYRAYDPQLDRMLALKIPIFQNDEHEKAARFEQEAKSAANLRHPNIVPVFDSGRVDGHYFIASQFIDGVPLSGHLKKGAVSFSQAATWVRAIAFALDYAHHMGVVHRDVKPQNIMLDSRNEPQLMDFGLAKRVNEDSTMTVEGSLLGTPAYMAPEQARGEVASVGPKSDQYALGAMLFELLTGQRAFDGPPHAVLAQVLSDTCPSPGDVRPDIPIDLSAITLKAMSKLPEQRYSGCKELAFDLDRWLKGESVSARIPTLPEQILRLANRNKSLTFVSLSLLAVIAISLFSLTWAFLLARDARGRAERNLEESRKQTEVANQQRDLANAERQRAENAESDAQNARGRAERSLEESRKQTEVANQQRDLANAERQRAENAESELLKKQESLRRSVYASRMTQLETNWRENQNAVRLSYQLDSIASDPVLTDLRNFEWYYWRNHFDRRFQKLPLDTNTLACEMIWGYEQLCCISDNGVFAIACDQEKALIWKIESSKIYKSVDLGKISITNHRLKSCFATSISGMLTLLLNFESSKPASSIAVVLDVETEAVASRFTDAAFVKLPGVGLVLRQKDSSRQSYKTFPAGLSLGSSLPVDAWLAGFDAINQKRLVATPKTIEWRSLPGDQLLDKLLVDQLEEGRTIIGTSISFPLQQIVVNTHLPNRGSSNKGFVLDWSLKMKASYFSGFRETVFCDFQPQAISVFPEGLHVFQESPWYELNDETAYGRSKYSLPLVSRQFGLSPDSKSAIGLATARRESPVVIPLLFSLQDPQDSFEYPYSGDLFISRVGDSIPRFASCKLLQDSLDIRLVQINLDGSTIETKKSIKFGFRKSDDRRKNTYDIRFAQRELCGLAEDGRSIQFFSLDGKLDTPVRTIPLEDVAASIKLDFSGNLLAVTYAGRSSKTRKWQDKPLLTGSVGVLNLMDSSHVKIDYEDVGERIPFFDNSGRWLFLLGALVANDDGAWTEFRRTKIYSTKTGEIVVDIPFPEGQFPVHLVADASMGIFARGTYIYRSDGSTLGEIEDGSYVRDISSDGKRLITQSSIVDSMSGEVLLQIRPELKGKQIRIHGDTGYSVVDSGIVKWFPFLRKD